MIESLFWQEKKVLITGHTGFKGSWLSLWLQQLGADIIGLSLAPHTTPNLYELAHIEDGLTSVIGDIRDLDFVQATFQEHQPDIVIHMAAQALVRSSYSDPVETYQTNVMGTMNVLEAIRLCPSIKAAVMVTSDKCYDNKETTRPYHEDDPLGGHDPYSSSKACAELLVSSYRQSFFTKEGSASIASARAGNVIGGGDWSEDRLITDIVKATNSKQVLLLRSPDAIRPWQHVLAPLQGYLMLAEKLFEQGDDYAQAWNFGPQEEGEKSVQWIVDYFAQQWHDFSWEQDKNIQPHEAGTLKLDSTKSHDKLGWQLPWTLTETLNSINEWYQKYDAKHDMKSVCQQQIKHFMLATRIPNDGASQASKHTEQHLRQDVLKAVERYSQEKFKTQPFISGETPVPVSGKVIGNKELEYLVESSLDAWLTTGRFNTQFERELGSFLGVKHVLTTNSGSSANLLALTALTSPKLGDRALQAGDEVITVAAGFPTTVNPILQNGLIPVFVDIDINTYNIDTSQIKAAISDKTKAIMVAHSLGNAFNLDEVISIAREHDLWVIEDCCDALGTTYTPSKDLEDYRGQIIAAGQTQHVGTFGDIATLSFYPAHHITMGEGGAVYTNNGKLKIIIESFRDWGRDCFCPPGKDNTCKKRFDYQLGELPCGYDHKYTYSHIGYNLKITDMQAAIALAQMELLPEFIQVRKNNFSRLYEGLEHLTEHLLLPQAEKNSEPSWFGFAITLKQERRAALIQFLESKKIASRLLFGGNLTKQPYFKDQDYRIATSLDVTDQVMKNTLWLGVFPAITDDMIDYIIESLTEFFD